MKEIEGRTYYSTKEVCQMAGISKSTLFRWIKKGIIKDADFRDRNLWRLFSEENVEEICKEANRTTKKE